MTQSSSSVSPPSISSSSFPPQYAIDPEVINGFLLSVNMNMNTVIPELQSRVKVLENERVPNQVYFKTATNVNKLVYYIVPATFVFFALGQTSLTIILYMYFGNDTTFNGYVKLIIGSVGLLGIAEIIWLLFYLPKAMSSLESKITKLENEK